MPFFAVDDKKIKKIIKDTLGSKEGDFNGQKMLCGTTINPVVVVNPTPILQDYVSLTVAAVQNTWYQVTEQYNARLYQVNILMATLAEDIEMRLTVDEQTFTDSQAAAVATTNYCGVIGSSGNNDNFTLSAAESKLVLQSVSFIDCRYFKLEIRKTSANAANNLQGGALFSLW